MNDQFLSNTYLVSDEAGGGFFVDAGGPVEPLIEAAERDGVTPTHVLLTHHHFDHVSRARQAHGALAGPRGADEPRRARCRRDDGRARRPASCRSATLTVTALPTPGHTKGMISLLVDGEVFTGDTLFKNSVGGVRAPGHTTLRGHQALDHGRAADAARADRDPPGPHGPDDGRRRARGQLVRAHLARASTPRATSRAPRWASRRR